MDVFVCVYVCLCMRVCAGVGECVRVCAIKWVIPQFDCNPDHGARFVFDLVDRFGFVFIKTRYKDFFLYFIVYNTTQNVFILRCLSAARQ